MRNWNDEQAWESNWWGSCVNTFGEETKQLTYAHRMGLTIKSTDGHWPVYDMQGKSVIDIGGGPCSMLLKAINLGMAVVVDPCSYPDWVARRYEAAGIEYVRLPAEEFKPPGRLFDEAWLYNVCQHVQDPGLVMEVTKRSAAVSRVFEWIDMPPTAGHPHMLTAAQLLSVFELGRTEHLHGENGCYGRAFYCPA